MTPPNGEKWSTHFIRAVVWTINERQQKEESRHRACWPYSDRPKYLPDLGRPANKIITEFWDNTVNWSDFVANLWRHFRIFCYFFAVFMGTSLIPNDQSWRCCCKKWHFCNKQKNMRIWYTKLPPPPFPQCDNSSRRGRLTMYRLATTRLQMFILEDERFI